VNGILIPLLWVLFVSGNFAYLVLPSPDCWAVAVFADLILVSLEVAYRNWVWAAVAACMVLYSAWKWWRRRKDRMKVLDAIGAKSRARLAALVRSMREHAKRRPVFRPVPGRV
jgi:hypothetical protein